MYLQYFPIIITGNIGMLLTTNLFGGFGTIWGKKIGKSSRVVLSEEYESSFPRMNIVVSGVL